MDPELLELEREEGAEGSETLRGLTTSLEKRFVWALKEECRSARVRGTM